MDSETRQKIRKERSTKVKKKWRQSLRVGKELKSQKNSLGTRVFIPDPGIFIPADQVPDDFKEKVRKLIQAADDFVRLDSPE